MHLLPHRRGPPLAELITLGLLLVDTASQELGVIVAVVLSVCVYSIYIKG